MFLPKKVNKLIDEKYQFRRTIPLGLKVTVDKGDRVKRDSILASGEIADEQVRLDLASSLRVKPQKVREYLECLSGVRVTIGDMLV